MAEITPEQQAFLDTWAGKRDAIVSEISNLQAQKDKLVGEVIATALSLTDVTTRTNQAIGRLAELSAKEKELSLMTSKEVADLTSQKSVLQAQVSDLEGTVDLLSTQKVSLENGVDSLTTTFNSMHEHINFLDKVFNNLTTINNGNVKVVEELISTFKKGMQDLIATNTDVVAKTNAVIDELPKVFLEVQRKSLIREKL